jgi:hypothetical protein
MHSVCVGSTGDTDWGGTGKAVSEGYIINAHYHTVGD